MSEQGQRAKITKALISLDAIAVENPALPGTPDVNYIGGWVELKWLRKWPTRAETVVRFDHFTLQQRVWHIRRRRAGGRCWMLIQCRREWLLLDGIDAALNVNQCNRAELIELCTQYWPSGLIKKELIKCITREPRDFTLTGADGEKLRKMLREGTTSPLDDI